jgi:hypothetical protein
MLKNVTKYSHITLPIVAPTLLLIAVSGWYILLPMVTEAETTISPTVKQITSIQDKKPYGDYYVVVHLNNNTITLHNGTTTTTLAIASQGKPGSYYETIGGAYMTNYKERTHFSSIGHVYMPYSIHVFGNYFIHGIPYYPDGTKVSSAYSGGCIRLFDTDAEILYAFIIPTTPIIITRGNEEDFIASATNTPTIASQEMTKLMVASISLELLTQDNEIFDVDGTLTTRRTILPRLLRENDSRVGMLYAESLGKQSFVNAMNSKAIALGMTNTTFEDTTKPAVTTEEDYVRFMGYISSYKSYLIKGSEK